MQSETPSIRIFNCDVMDGLAQLSDQSVDCVVTSPPYWGLRDYGVAGQIGIEPSPEAFIARMVEVFNEVRRVLRDDGTLWLNIGDTYRDKQLVGVPWRTALALQADGWLLRSEIIWDKAAHKPERVRDRPTNSHERFFLFSKKPRYFYDADAVAMPSASSQGRPQRARAEEIAKQSGLTEEHLAAIRSVGITDVGKARETQSGVGRNRPEVQALADEAKAVLKGYFREFLIGDTVNMRSVWKVKSTTYPGVHTAVFPPALIEPCIKAGCPVGGTVLDPFGGAGTTGLVADRLQRNAILIELNPEYAAMAEHRINSDRGQLLDLMDASKPILASEGLTQ